LRRGRASCGLAWHGREWWGLGAAVEVTSGAACLGEFGQGRARSGEVRSGAAVGVGHGVVRCGAACCVRHGAARPGVEGQAG